MKHFHNVGSFHQKFDLDNVTFRGVGPRTPPRELLNFRLKFLIEELKEIATAMGVNLEVEVVGDVDESKLNIPDLADGLIDLDYVTLGTAHVLGLPWADLHNEVQRANMAKERATRPQESRRGSTFDVIKPEGWQPPDITGVLRRHGWML